MSEMLWQPSERQIKQTQMYQFMKMINERFNCSYSRYEELYRWSVDNIPEFWAAMWDFAQIKFSAPYTEVVDNLGRMPGAGWFSGAKLNFAENLLRYRDGRTALIFKGESNEPVKLNYTDLYDEVARLAVSLKQLGVKSGDRVAGFMPNMPQTIIAMLAAASIGAAWSSCSPDFGIKGVLDRFGQIQPKVLFTADGYFFKGKKIDSLSRISQILKKIPSVKTVVVTPYTDPSPDIGQITNAILFDEFKS